MLMYCPVVKFFIVPCFAGKVRKKDVFSALKDNFSNFAALN
jgi:hypothetical protein